ncbi:MAG: mevalonate kinase [Thermoplasmatales archaeon]|nr:mevalonate kinase [Thermoplasmatales archaeon]
MVVAISPGKIILFGEHGVVYGKPCLSVAISLKVAISVEKSDSTKINDDPLNEKKHSYISKAIEKLWKEGGGVSISTFSQIPSASGLGSSAALTTACVASLLSMNGKFSLPEVARKSFEVEYDVQKIASPNDTSVCAKGGAIFVSNKRGDNFLWSIEKDGKEWYIHSVELPPMKFVIGNTGAKSKTPLVVKKVEKFVKQSSFAKELLEEMEDIVIEGKKALEKNDYVGLGEIMNKNQKILHTIGASSREIEKLIDITRKAGAYGAKLTGAGGGGSVIAISDEPEKIVKEMRSRDCDAFVVSVAKEGVKVWS